jgi:hypothetical protein
MPEYKGFQSGKISMPDLVVNFDDSGGVTATASYVVKTENWEIPQRGQSIGSVVDGVPSQISFLSVASVTAKTLEGGLTEVTVSFSGSSSSSYTFDSIGNNPPIYRLDCRLTERNILEHPKVRALEENQQAALRFLYEGSVKPNLDYSLVGTIEFDEYLGWSSFVPMVNYDNETITLTGDAQKFCKLIHKGVRSYMFPAITWTEVVSGNKGLESRQLNDIGKVDNPRGNPPEPSGGRNWMLTGANQEQKGEKLYQTTLEWTLSEEDGWDEELYE